MNDSIILPKFMFTDFVSDSDNIKTGFSSKKNQRNAPIASINTDYQTKYFGYNENVEDIWRFWQKKNNTHVHVTRV